MLGLADTQIKNAYEQENMTPEQIAEDLGFEIVAVKAKLMQISSQFRKDCGQEDPDDEELNFTNDELRAVNKVIYETAIGAEDEHLRLKAAIYVRDDKKGRKEVVKGVQHSGNFNILTINQVMQTAREGAAKVKQAMGGGSNKVIEA